MSVDASYDPAEIAAERLDRGEIDVFFFVGGEPVTLIEGLVACGKAALVPIDGAGRKRLIAVQHACLRRRDR